MTSTTSRAVQPRAANDGNVLLEGTPRITRAVIGRVARYQNVRSAAVADWSGDGGSLHVLTRFAAVTQLHRVNRPGGARHQLTFYEEPVLEAVRRPGDEELLLTMDEGGSEFWQLFLFRPESGERVRVSDGESRNSDPCWSRDGRRLAFTSTRRTGRENDVWVMEADDPEDARCVLEAGDGANWGAADWDAEGRRLVVYEYVSITESRIHVVDVESGERRLVAGGDAATSWLGVAPMFTAEEELLVATDARAEFRQLARLDPETGATEILTADIPWDVELLALSEDRRRGAFAVNRDGYSDLYLLDPATGKHAHVEHIRAGVLHGLRFAPDGRSLALTLAPVDGPADVYALPLGDSPLEHGAPERWTSSETGPLRRDRIAVPELVRYPSFDDRRIPAFVYRPSGTGPHPVVVQIHGGPESQTRPDFVPSYQMWIEELGAAVIRPNVRGSSGYGKTYLSLDNGRLREDSVRDVGALLDWIAGQPDLDEHRVAVYGGSYGGYMVLAALVHYGERLAAGVELVGISNFVTFLENTQGYRQDLRRVEYGDERDPEMRAFLESISPSTHASEIRTPLFVAQGANDPRVPESESRQIVDAVRANDRPVWYMNALNEGHGFRRRENQDLFVQLVLMFLERHLVGVG